MKQRIKNIFILSIASLVFFVGAGVTIVDLCCPKCFPKVFSPKEHSFHCVFTSELAAKGEMHSCCNEDSAPQKDEACKHQDEDQECGTAERISVDITNTISKPSIANPLVWCVTTLHTDLLGCLVTKAFNYDIGNEGLTPVLIPPRDYLSLIRILII